MLGICDLRRILNVAGSDELLNGSTLMNIFPCGLLKLHAASIKRSLDDVIKVEEIT